jgi:hypothetical protein
MSPTICHKAAHLSSVFLCLAVLAGSSVLADADCSQGGCPNGQRCVGDGKSPILHCIPEPPAVVGGFNVPMAPHVVPDGPSQPIPSCHADSDCRKGYQCDKGDLDPKTAEYSAAQGIMRGVWSTIPHGRRLSLRRSMLARREQSAGRFLQAAPSR